MKRTSTLLFALALGISSIAQTTPKKDTTWNTGGLFALTISQSNFTNWAAGGENSYSANGKLGLFANHTKEKSIWENNLDLAYGISNQSNVGLRKTDDLAELNSKYGFKANDKWYYSVVFNSKTQFDKGYQYSNIDSIEPLVISRAFAPMYLNLAIGMDYKPNKYTSLFLSPLNTKNIYVYDEKFGERYSIDSAMNLRTDVGALVNFKYEREVLENINFLTKLNLFANYLDLKGVDDVDLSWEVLVTMNVFKVLSVNLNTHLIWDKDVKTVNTDGTLGDAKVQFKEIFGAGIAYKF